MANATADSELFDQIIRDLLQRGLSVRFQARGASMSPTIRDREFVQVTPVMVSKLRKDDIVLAKSNSGFRLHRIVISDPANDVFITRGDCGQEDDPPLTGAQILGLAQAKEVRVGRRIVRAGFKGLRGRALRSAARAQVIVGRLLSRVPVSNSFRIWMTLGLLTLIFSAASLSAQVTLDSASSNSAELASGFGTTGTLTIAHTTGATGVNRLMVVGVSINISNGTSAKVSGVKWNGAALTSLGAHNDSGNKQRVEMWYLLAPATGTANVVVSFTLPTFTTEGVAAGVTTFTGVDQTVPLGAFASADDGGTAAAFSQLNVTGVVNGMILDTLAIAGNRTVTVPSPQAQQWNLNTGGSGTTDVTATGSTRSGAPSVPLSETFSNTSNWSLGAASINPSGADIGVTTSVSAVALGQNSTYNITIKNNGPSAANNVTLTDSYATTGLSVVSVTPSTGTSCTTSTTINCTLPTPFASGATATVAVVVSTTAAGFYPNTATVTDSAPPPDPNTGNNTYVALAPVVSVVCGTSALAAGGTLSGQQNTYYPGAATVSAGATSIPLGTANGTGTISLGTELLVIQMQDASINDSNSVAYGNGYTGTGFTTINNAGNYEFVTATGPISGGSVPVLGAGIGGGLVFGYNAIAPGTNNGASTYQVVLVPQYSSATLGAITIPAWNGSTGGILALDVAGVLNLGTATVSVSGLGFRGGAGMQLIGGVGGANTDYLFSSPATYTGAAGGAAGVDASKGEGVAGTPMWVESGGNFLQTTTTVGYPSGTAGTDGSMARGAPANAGAGGTDADPSINDQNAGGGGGGNGGSGGFGGDSWSTNLSTGGEGGAPFPATIDRVAMGGGGGAGSRNNSDGDGQASGGAAGGGIVFIRAYSFSGTATITANGANAYNGTANDAGGGGGAGGTIVMLAAAGGESGLTLQANGGTGGNAWATETFTLANRHGPGGGGGGGVVYVSGTPASVSVTGGADGLTENPGVPYGSTSGSAGTSSATATMSQVTGLQSSEVCSRLPDLTITKGHGGGNVTRGGTISYTLQVSNVNTTASAGVVTMNDTLPLGATPTAASGTGWTCSISGQTVSCSRADALGGGAAYPAITVTANVTQSAPATITNSGVIGGGGDVSPLNDTGTDIANVVSSADLSMTDTASPDPVAAGSNITYTQTINNAGPSAADNAMIVAAVPANTTFVSIATPTGWSCSTPGSGGTGNVVCTDVNMAGSTMATFTMIVKVNSAVTNGTVITGVVSASSSTSDPNSANNTASASTVVGTTAQAQMTVTNSASPDPVVAGSDITYTQTATNTGSASATNPTLSEVTPANTTFQSIAAPTGTTCTTPAVGGTGTITCTAPAAPAGTSGTVVLVLQVNSGTASGTIITDTVTATSTNQAFGVSSATATDVVAIGTQADLALTTTATPASVFAGNNITYTQTVTNNGPATSSGVVFTQATPTNTVFESVSAPAGWTCTTPAVGATGTVTCNDVSLAANNSADIIVVVNVPSTVTAASISSTSNISATTSDPTTANNSTTVSTPVVVACDLAVTNSGTPNPVQAGNNITYTQVITNSGPSNCSTGTFSEATPANTTFVSVAAVTTGGGTWTCPNTQPVACTNPSVPPGSTGTITAIYKVNTGVASGTIITDTATAATTSRDTNTANNSAISSIAVASTTQADLSATNSASPNPVTAGGNITYTQTVSNAGPATANAPVLTETLPANTTAVSLTGSAGWTCVLASLTCTDTTTMTATSTANFTFVVKVNTNATSGSTITQSASIASTTSDPNTANNTATVNVQVADSADLAITNAASPVPVEAGNNITYTQVVTNNGPSNATAATLTETTPINTTFQSISAPAGWSCITPAVGATGTITCIDPSLAPGSGTFSIQVKVNASTAAGTTIIDVASVTSSVSDPNTSNNSAAASDVVASATQADLIVTNSATPTSLPAGSNVTYTQTVTNNGPAAATTVSFTEVTPPNTTFQSITPAAGWTCGTVPAKGGTGTITCTLASLAVGSANTGTFTLVLQVNSATPSGTNITDTDTATASNIVSGISSNTASATVLVANSNSADMAIVKTATPNPVTEDSLLTYSLAVTNNGPASATNVTVTDTLPSSVTYLNYTASQGSCSEAGGVVTCLLGTMANAGTASITVLTMPGTPGMVSNTANVSADQTDPNLTNNTSTWDETVVAATSVKLQSFSAHLSADRNGASHVLLTWKTGGESHNFGFNVYREQNGIRERMNPSLIAGSALLMSGALPQHSGRSYAWLDPSAEITGASYWLEDVDVNGIRTMHGPVSVTGASTIDDATASETRMLSQLSQVQVVAPTEQGSHFVEAVPLLSAPTPTQIQKQFELASHSAIKIQVRHEGWYRVPQPDLVKAGLDPNIDASLLHLYAEANEQPVQITGAVPGPGGFGPQAAIYFYGTGIDTPFSGTREYWLVSGNGPGARIPQLQPASGSNQPPADYLATVELQQHTTYFAALLTPDDENFFGAIISPTPVEQVLNTPQFDTKSTLPARLNVVLQGVIVAYPHDVQVELNGTNVGDVTFVGQAKGTLSVTIPAGLLQNSSNTVTLTAQNGEYDTSLVQSIRITYPHLYIADSDTLKFSGRAGDELNVSGFSSAPTVLDITDPNHPVNVMGQVAPNNGKYTIALQVPWTTTNPASPVRHTLLAVAADTISTPAGVAPNHPSHWHSAQPGADIAMITYQDFAAALVPLVDAHRANGKSSVVVPINDLYDEFNFGEHSPFAIRQFLQSAQQNWKKAPSYLLLNGRSSFDPRDYLGFGHLDLVPTRILPTTSLMTASDDWFSDFNDSGMPTMATGRLPVSSQDEAVTVVGKIVAYEGQMTNGRWTSQAMFVADKNDTENFTQDAQTVQAQLPATIQATDVFTTTIGTAAAQQEIFDGINSGQLLVNYTGHGSEEEWSGSDIFDVNTVPSLTNGSQLPVFLIMDCLNGFFQDVYAQPLGVVLLLAPNGGAVAVLASTGLNQAAPQTKLDALVVQNALNVARPTLGESILKAKSKIGDPAVRRTFVLFGDPAMQVKQPVPTAAMRH